MARSSQPREQSLEAYFKSLKGDSLNYNTVFALLCQKFKSTQWLLITTLPRGGLQIAQPPHVPEALLRGYVKDFHALDRPSWMAIARRQPVRAIDCWSSQDFQSTRYYREFLAPNGLAFVAAAPLRAPLLEGYPGAITLLRAQQQGRFTESDLSSIGQAAAMLEEAIARTRTSRNGAPDPICKTKRKPRLRQFIFDSQLKPRLGSEDLNKLDERLRQQMVQHARQRFEHVNGKEMLADRVPLPDSSGDLWNFRVVVHNAYPALGDGPFVFFCLQPDCGEWSHIRPIDFQADAELSRLIPAMRFMDEQFMRGPTLGEISKTVHLSPFHFHRRFTELLGITPKHFMLDCQIAQAKRELLAGDKDLAKIATDCGFAHQSHFTSRFKQATGLTPTRWRRMATEAQRSSMNN